ncbi:helix-turn-helix domain-containing protein [Clostridiaceae bacterium]|nr:helix-turn-helix domain-containing protein [Clostridiaceae bacterium]NBI81196.1 helix-turn-helix domain-containing protein [Clostridiaceae bacterium]RKJ83030.1 helix-turn-helix domain-containing protein [Butyricicoccus sp. 1XD8-22]
MSRKKHKHSTPYRPKVAYGTIVAAKSGDYFAIQQILAEYRPMIRRLAMRRFREETGLSYSVADPCICQQIENDLIHAILYNFNI